MINKIYLIMYMLGVSLVQASNDIGISNSYSLFIGKFLVAISFIYISIHLLKKNPKITLIIFILIASLKFYSLIDDQSEFLLQLYLISIAGLFYMMGMYSYKIHNYNPIKQIFWFSVASIPILLMQNINWPEFISYYNTQKFIDGEDKSYYFWPLFKSLDQIPIDSEAITTQAKPSGLTWSNAFTGFLLNLSLYLVLFIAPLKKKFNYSVIILLGCIFCGAKVTIFGSFILIIVYIYKNSYIANKAQFLLAYFLILLSYFFIFPAFFSFNLSIEALSMSFLSRYYDALGWFGIGAFDETLELLSTNYSIHNYSIELFGSLSSFNYVIIGFLVILLFIAINFFLNKKLYYFIINILNKDYIIGYLFLMGITLSSTALQFNSILWFFNGYIFEKLKNDRSV